MFFFNPFLTQLRNQAMVQREHRGRKTKANPWNNIGKEIEQSIRGVLEKHGINYSR